MKNSLKNFLQFFKESIRDLSPIILVIVIFQWLIIQKIPDNWKETSIGIFIVAIGMAIFLMWLKYAIFPIWEKLAEKFTQKKWYFLLMIFGFLVGFSTTIAEPALWIIAQKAAIISEWKIHPDHLRFVVALSVWIAISVWILRILRGIPIHYPIMIWYVLVVWITFITPPEIVWLAYDLWWVTTSTITVPLVTAIGIWVAAISQKKNPIINWFGLIACASLFPMFFVQLYWIYIYNFWEISDISNIIIQSGNQIESHFSIQTILVWLIETIKDVIPIVATIYIFQYIILKQPVVKHELKKLFWGFLMVIVWLYFFILGLEIWLFNLWNDMASELTQLDNKIIIYLFAFSIWFSTTMAEPTLIAISNKASEITQWKIDAFILRVFVALWVWIWITIGTYRIIYGDFIHYYIIVWYLIVIALTYFSPKYITSIAYDSWWVTTSTVTVPLVAALWIWLALNIPWRDPLYDWFWLIAFASLFPIMSVLAYGIISKFVTIKVKWKYKDTIEHDIPDLK